MKQREEEEEEEEDDDDEEEEEQEEEEEEDDDKEKVLSQSLRKRDKNIQENKAMVMPSHNLFAFSLYSVICIPELYLLLASHFL